MAKEKPTTKTCKHCKTEIPYDAKVCPQCRKKQKGGKLKWILGVIVLIIVFAVLGGGSSYELSEDASTMTKKEYTAACEKIAYKDLARATDEYTGTKVKFTGEIQQVVYDSDNGESQYLISVTKDEYDFWDDNVYVCFNTSNSETKFLEEDIVTFYGEVSGEETYTSILGESITIPSVTAVYMNLKK